MMDQMTRAAKVDADKEQHSKDPNEHPKNKEAGGGPTVPVATSTGSKDELAGKSKGDSSFSIIRDNGAVGHGSGVYSMVLLMAVSIFSLI